MAQLLALLALQPHSKKVMGLIPAWGAVGSGGQVLPRVHSAQVGYLLGLSVCVCMCVCVEFACSPQTFSAQVGYLLGLSVWSLHVLPVFTRGFLH